MFARYDTVSSKVFATPPHTLTHSLTSFLSSIAKPLRELTRKEVEWVWDHPQEMAFKNIQEAITKTSVLRYYNVDKEVTIQCDASQAGLGAALMQGDSLWDMHLVP